MLRPRGTKLHYEVELALVMGRTVRDLDPNDEKGAMDAIRSNSPLLYTHTYIYTLIYIFTCDYDNANTNNPKATLSRST